MNFGTDWGYWKKSMVASSGTRAYSLATLNKLTWIRTSNREPSIIYFSSSHHYYLWHVFDHFCKFFFQQRRSFVCKFVCHHAHAEARTERLITLKSGIEVLKRVFEKTSRGFFFKSRCRFFKIIFERFFFSDFCTRYSFNSR